MRLLLAFLLVGSVAATAEPSLRDLWSPYATLPPEDSIVALTLHGPDTVEARLSHGTPSTAKIPSSYRARVLSAARSEGVPVDSTLLPAPPAQASMRAAYVMSQTLQSWYIYGISLPVAARASSINTYVGAELLAIPGSIFTHLYLSKDREVGEAEFNGIEDATWSSLAAGYATGFALWGDDFRSFQTAAVLTAASYPFALRYGFGYGRSYRDNPDRIQLRMSLADIGAVAGALVPIAMSDGELPANLQLRVPVACAFAGYLGGHLLADQWQPGSRVASGIGPGITQTAVLGALWGLEIDALTDFQGLRASLIPILIGGSAGTAIGWHSFKGTPDTRERSGYTALGMWGGCLGGTGMLMLIEDGKLSNLESTTAWTLGPTLGYLAARALTTELVESTKTPTSRAAWIRSSEFDPIPSLAYMKRSPLDKPEREWRIAGLRLGI